MSRHVPFMRSIVLTQANTEYNLYDLLLALEPDTPKRCQMIQLQFDWQAGADLLYVGNQGTVSATDRGVELAASQAVTLQSMEANLIHLPDIALLSSGAGHTVNVTMVTR